jgi:hypothetical protein
LKTTITSEIDDVDAEIAMNVPEAMTCIERAKRSNLLYHAVVLDIMLPPRAGLTAAFDESICRELRRLMPHTLIAHITAWEHNETVKNHVELVHGPSEIDLSFSLSKDISNGSKKEGYSAKLIERLRPFLYGLRIEEQLNDLFNGGGLAGYPVMRARPDNTSHRSRTFELAALTRNISNDWKFLGEGLRARIKDIFTVVESEDGQVSVSLF